MSEYDQPLRLVEDKQCEYSHAIYQGDRIVADVVKHVSAEATGKRLVACYNALAGVPDDKLEQFVACVKKSMELNEWLNSWMPLLPPPVEEQQE